MDSICHDDNIHTRFYRLRHQSLQRDRLYWQPKPSHISQNSRVASDHHTNFITCNWTFRCFHTNGFTIYSINTGYFTLLKNIHSHLRTCSGITPGHCIVSSCATSWLPKCAKYWIPGSINIYNWAKLFDFLGADKLCQDALQRVRVCSPLIAPYLVLCLSKHHHASGAEHDIII